MKPTTIPGLTLALRALTANTFLRRWMVTACVLLAYTGNLLGQEVFSRAQPGARVTASVDGNKIDHCYFLALDGPDVVLLHLPQMLPKEVEKTLRTLSEEQPRLLVDVLRGKGVQFDDIVVGPDGLLFRGETLAGPGQTVLKVPRGAVTSIAKPANAVDLKVFVGVAVGVTVFVFVGFCVALSKA